MRAFEAVLGCIRKFGTLRFRLGGRRELRERLRRPAQWQLDRRPERTPRRALTPTRRYATHTHATFPDEPDRSTEPPCTPPLQRDPTPPLKHPRP